MFLTGRTKDGSDAIQTGMYISPDGNEWSNMPYTKEQKTGELLTRYHWELFDYLGDNLRSFNMELELVLQKKSKLPRRLRDYMIVRYNESLQDIDNN